MGIDGRKNKDMKVWFGRFGWLCLLIGLAACATPQTVQKTSATRIPEAEEKTVQTEGDARRVERNDPGAFFEPREERSTAALNSTPSDLLLVEFKRSSCLGACPADQFRLYADGRAYYIGRAQVARIGNYQTRLSQEQIQAFQLAALKARFFSLADQYPTNGALVSDLPNTETMIYSRGQSKRVLNNHDAPETLRQFEDFLIRTIEALSWEPAQR